MQQKLTNINTRRSNEFLVITIFFPSLYGDNVIQSDEMAEAE